MPELPPHLESFCETLAAAHIEWNLSSKSDPAKLRAILEAAQDMADARAMFRTDSGECGFCGNDPSDDPDFGCDPDCPHRKLKEALADD